MLRIHQGFHKVYSCLVNLPLVEFILICFYGIGFIFDVSRNPSVAPIWLFPQFLMKDFACLKEFVLKKPSIYEGIRRLNIKEKLKKANGFLFQIILIKCLLWGVQPHKRVDR